MAATSPSDERELGEDEGDEELQFSFLVIGDWGQVTSYTRSTSALMSGLAVEETLCRFVLALGDNFYPSGVTSVSDRRWTSAWHHLYLCHPNLRMPWHAVLGNHDYEGEPAAQIEFTDSKKNASMGGFWHMPASSYSFSHHFELAPKCPSDSPDVEFFALDTNGCQEYIQRAYPFLREQLHADILQLAAQLKSSPARFKIVYGHHPCYTKGIAHGKTGDLLREKELFKHGKSSPGFNLEQALTEGGACAYFSGHEHVFQVCGGIFLFCLFILLFILYFSFLKKHHYVNGVHHFVCGASGAFHPGYYCNEDRKRTMEWNDAKFHSGVVRVKVFKSHLQVEFWSSRTRTVIHTVQVQPPSKKIKRKS